MHACRRMFAAHTFWHGSACSLREGVLRAHAAEAVCLGGRAKASGELEAEEAAQILRKALYQASRGRDKGFTQTAATALIYLLRHSPEAQRRQACTLPVNHRQT